MSIPLLIQAGDRVEFEKILLAENIEIHSPNTIRIEPNGKTIRIDQIRELRSYLVNSGSSYRQILFYSFEKLLGNANRFLGMFYTIELRKI